MRAVVALLVARLVAPPAATHAAATTADMPSLATTPLPNTIPEGLSAVDSEGNWSMEFVNVIKDVLRRNNDDYAELSPNWSHTWLRNRSSNRLSNWSGNRLSNWSGNWSESRAPRSPITYSVRRPPSSRAPSPDHFYYTKANGSSLNDMSGTNARRFFIPTVPAAPTVGASSPRPYPKHVNKLSRADKFLKMMARKGKQTLRAPALRSTAFRPDEGPPPGMAGGAGVAGGAGLPDEEQLDMAPARGGRVHALREAGRLCARHVLLPEGPKYGRAGRSYLPAYTPYRGHQFPDTRPPTIILPRCCNCCKKSVLGCE